jgi:putative heme iron utilization protein
MPEPDKINPIRETTDEARALARSLIEDAQFASIAVLEPETGYPQVSRVAVAMEEDGSPFILASDLSGHSKALAVDGRASLLCGEPPGKGDPLAFPRVTVIGRVEKLPHDDDNHAVRRAFWLKKHPKSQMYIDFADFAFYRMTVERVALNGGFGQAFEMGPEDIAKPVAT